MGQGKGLAALLHFLSPTDEVRSWSGRRERKEMNKIYAGKKKERAKVRRGEAGRLGPPHDTHPPTILDPLLPLKPVFSLQSLRPLLPFTLMLNRQLIAGSTTHKHISPFFAKRPAKNDASPFQAHVCHFVITMAPITLTPQNTSLASILHFPQRIAACTSHPMTERDYSWQTVIAPRNFVGR